LELRTNQELGRRIINFFEKELIGCLLAPYIVLTEFVAIAGARKSEELLSQG
jgi:hypothetical protein